MKKQTYHATRRTYVYDIIRIFTIIQHQMSYFNHSSYSRLKKPGRFRYPEKSAAASQYLLPKYLYTYTNIYIGKVT